MARLLCKACIVAAMVVLSGQATNAATCWQFVSKDDYPNCLKLDANLVLHWRTVNNQTLELVPDGDGYMKWVAIGISEAGMKGVDFSVMYLPTQGNVWLTGDFFTVDYVDITYDEVQDIDMPTMPVFDDSNHTLAVFQRPLDSCDAQDIPVLLNVERSIVWAYDWETVWDKARPSLADFTGGVRQGVRLFAADDASAPAYTDGDDDDGENDDDDDGNGVKEDAETLTLAMPSAVVPPALTSIMCVNLALPNDTAYSVISYTGFNATSLVVRMMGYVCAPGVTPPQPLGVPYACDAMTTAMPALPAGLPVGCETLQYVWVPGARGFRAPREAGFRIGAGAATAMVLQVHYWNLAAGVGQVDSSGFTLSYTSRLRNASLGVLTVGNTDMRIPANNDSFTALPNICPAACTAKRVLQPVTLVSNFFLMGGLGKSILTRHIRNGAAIMPVGRVDYWDGRYTGFQSVFPESRTLLPNDTIISLCTYNSTGRKAMTFFGYKNGSELCFNYITFYPASDMPSLDYCVARTRDNVSSCGTRSQLTVAAQAETDDFFWNGTRVQVGELNIAYYKSEQCIEHVPRKPNTRAAVAAIVLVPLCLILVGVILWTKYGKQEELEALLAQARAGGLTATTAD